VSLSRPRLVVAALRGGGGKTTISLGLLAAWRRKGLNIIPFKKGPDYIDAGWLAQAANRPCHNLDPFLMGSTGTLDSFLFQAGQEADGALVEGNRGLYDGADRGGTNSTAELAKLIRAPVILIVDCTKATRTLAAVVLGCRQFDPGVRLAGVVLNRLATSRQEALVRSTIEDFTGVPVLGAIPGIREKDLPERHLGLVPHQEHPAKTRVLAALADLSEKYLDMARIWEIMSDVPALAGAGISPLAAIQAKSSVPVKVGVIFDSAFQFYYPENLEILERLGAKLVNFSALTDSSLPEVDALYLGGGFPETHAEILAENVGLRGDLKRAAGQGLPVYAECGGLMYLGRELEIQGRTYPMAGVFPVTFGLEKKPQGHGYTVLEAETANPYYPVGSQITGHEFHYSRPVRYDEREINLVMKVRRGYGFDRGLDGLVFKNVLATYTHLHALGEQRWAEALVELAARKKTMPS